MSAIESIKQLLRVRTGVIAETLGPETIERAVADRCLELGLPDAKRYSLELITNEAEMNRLIDGIVIPESWFFRDVKPFQFLGEWVAENPPSPERPLRALSAPCAAGEEPYTIAMTFLDAGLAPDAFHIDGVDISHQLTSQAGRVPFGALSFRGGDLAFRDRYFTPTEAGGYQLTPTLSKTVRFRQGNLTASDFLAHEPPYRIIFCRNVLIYLDDASRQQILTRLKELLAPDGVLFVGHVEGGPLVTEHFTPIPEPGVFAYRKKVVTRSRRTTKKAPITRFKSSSQRLGSIKPATAKSTLRTTASPTTPLQSKSPTQAPNDLLAKAEACANAGQTSAAKTHCREHLDRFGPSAKAYFLLGVIQMDSDSKEAATENLKKAIYLDPAHTDALMHLALLAQARGDQSGELRYRRQLERARNQKAGVSQ